MANKHLTPEEREKLWDEIRKWQSKYEQKFGEYLLIGVWGVPSQDAVKVIKKSLKAGKPHEFPKHEKGIAL